MKYAPGFYLLDTLTLDGLAKHAEPVIKKSFFSKTIIDDYWDYIAANALVIEPIKEDRDAYEILLAFLEETNIDLAYDEEYHNLVQDVMRKRNTGSHYFFTFKQKKAFSHLLHPSSFDILDIADFNADYCDNATSELAETILSALEQLRNNIERIANEKQILYLGS